MSKPEKKVSRSGFLKQIGLDIFGFVDEIFGDELDALEKAFPELVRPPGHLPESEFLSRCSRCGACIRACPFIALQPVIDGNAFDRGTPCLRTGTSFCRFCGDFPCINACPTGALAMSSPHDRIGQAKINPATCLHSHGQECSACYLMCDRTFKAISLTESGKPPAVDRDKCTGCGACVTVCPITPVTAIKVTCDR